MSGLSPPGAGVDIGPTWLIEESTMHSKAEHQRSERVGAQKRRDHKGDRKGDGKNDKPKGRGKGSGGKASP
jgi:hypothetical protein